MHSVAYNCTPCQQSVDDLPYISTKLTLEQRLNLRLGPLSGPGPASGPGDGPLVNSAISGRTSLGHLPPWLNVPLPRHTTYYRVYRQDVHVCLEPSDVPPSETSPGLRAEILEFSQKSRRNLRHVAQNSGWMVKSQFALTYHETWPQDGKVLKAHLQAFLKRYRRLTDGACYLWVLEFQRRGAPHFHLFFGVEPEPYLQIKLAQAWVEITGGTSHQYSFHVHPKNWITWKMQDASYVMKYASKMDQKTVPEQFQNVGRFWGNSRDMKPVPMIIEPRQIAAPSRGFVTPWTGDAITRLFNRTLRRYHEKCMNYDRKTGLRRLQPWKSSPLGRQDAKGGFCIPFGTKLLIQLMNYVATNPPDAHTAARIHQETTPF